VDGARVLTADVRASNGLIHVIDAVILPRPDLVDTAVAAGSFQTLVTAVKAAGLVETLKGEGPFTVFAPTDAAFARLPEGAIASLLENLPQLASILKYHVVPGRILAGDVGMGTSSVRTADGRDLTVTKDRDGTVRVNGIRVVEADVLAGNGIVHVVEGVVLPPQQ
jgi:transforming growth factor-beta-induced protein